jgi:hypothetical protein
MGAEQLGDGQDEVGGGDPGTQLAGEFEADDGRDQRGHRQAQHRRLGLDASHTPPQHAETVDHGRVGVGADEGVRERLAVPEDDDVREVLEVDLVHDPGSRRDDGQLSELPLPPLEEAVALVVAEVLLLDVQREGVRPGEVVGDDRVVDGQLRRDHRVDRCRVSPELGDRLPHGGQVDEHRDAVGVVQEHPRGRERHGVARARARDQPVDGLAGHRPAVLVSQQVLQQHLE